MKLLLLVHRQAVPDPPLSGRLDFEDTQLNTVGGRQSADVNQYTWYCFLRRCYVCFVYYRTVRSIRYIYMYVVSVFLSRITCSRPPSTTNAASNIYIYPEGAQKKKA